jgi:hypothetical protein
MFNRENPQNSEPQNGPRSGLDYIALRLTMGWNKLYWSTYLYFYALFTNYVLPKLNVNLPFIMDFNINFIKDNMGECFKKILWKRRMYENKIAPSELIWTHYGGSTLSQQILTEFKKDRVPKKFIEENSRSINLSLAWQSSLA